MAGSMKEIKLRIKSVESTMQITKAMELVASSKLRRAKERAELSRPYFTTLRQTLTDIVSGSRGFTSVYLEQRPVKRTCYVVIAGDRGLAGGYNANVFKVLAEEKAKARTARIVAGTFSAEEDAEERAEISSGRPASKTTWVIPVGKKALEYTNRNHMTVLSHQFGVAADVGVSDCFAMAKLLCDGFRAGDFDRVIVCYTKFNSMLSQEATTMELLPLRPADTGRPSIWDKVDGGASRSAEGNERKTAAPVTLYDPDGETVFNTIVPEYAAGLIYGAMCESVVSELAARRTAMDAASKNAAEMIDTLNLNYNRARQAAITQEITEIIGGAG